MTGRDGDEGEHKVEIIMEKGGKADIDELGQLYDSLNEYLSNHTNYPGWIKGIYPVRETAAEGVEEGCLYVARSEGRIVGTVILRHEPEPAYAAADWHVDLDDSEVYVIYTLAVHPDFQNAGAGKQLMDFILEFARTSRVKALRLDVYEKNIPAISLYRKYGFDYIDTVDLGYSEYGLDWFELYQRLL